MISGILRSQELQRHILIFLLYYSYRAHFGYSFLVPLNLEVCVIACNKYGVVYKGTIFSCIYVKRKTTLMQS